MCDKTDQTFRCRRHGEPKRRDFLSAEVRCAVYPVSSVMYTRTNLAVLTVMAGVRCAENCRGVKNHKPSGPVIGLSWRETFSFELRLG